MAPRAKLAHSNFPAGHWSWDHTATLLTSFKSFLKRQLSSEPSGVSLPVPPLKIPFLGLVSVFSAPYHGRSASCVLCPFALSLHMPL